MWTPLRQEIDKIIREHNLIDSIWAVSLSDWKSIESTVYDRFYDTKTHRYRSAQIWESLKVVRTGLQTALHPFSVLDRFIDHNTGVYLLLNETINEHDKFWIYEGTILPLQVLISESEYTDEVTIVDKKFNWILCINHHDMIVVGGQEMVDKLERLRTELEYN